MISIEVKKKFATWKILELNKSIDLRLKRLQELGCKSHHEFYIERMKEIEQTRGEINAWTDILQSMCGHNNMSIVNDDGGNEYYVCDDCGYTDHGDVTSLTPIQRVTTHCETCDFSNSIMIDGKVERVCAVEAELDLVFITNEGIDCVFWQGHKDRKEINV